MKNIHLLILLISSLLVSCNKEKVQKLNKRVSELEMLNSKLMDSVAEITYQKVSNSDIIGISSKPILKIGQKEKVKFVFNYPDKLLEYNVYTSTPDGKPDKLILQNLTDNEFDYEFTPKVLGEEKVKLIAVFKINHSDIVEISIPTNTGFKTSE